MIVLVSGLDTVTTNFMQQNGLHLETLGELADSDELQDCTADGRYFCAVVDLETSGLGVYCCKILRAKHNATVVIGITAGSDNHNWSNFRATFLENGGDDLLLAPVNPRELVASIRSAYRRLQHNLTEAYEYRIGNKGERLQVNVKDGSVCIDGKPFALTGSERKLLVTLARSPGRTLSKEQLLGAMYIDNQPELKIIDVFVCKVRRKLEEQVEGGGKIVETLWGQGYRLVNIKPNPTTVEQVT